MGPEPTSNDDNNCTDEQSNKIQPNFNVNRLKPMPKTPAERSRDYRARLRAARQENQNHVSRPAPKTSAERNPEFRARQKELQRQNPENDEITSGPTLPSLNGNLIVITRLS